MKRIIKKYKVVIIIVAVESYYYFVKKPDNLEIFFMTWIFIASTLLLFNIFNLDGSTVGFSGKANNYLNGFSSQKEYVTKKKANNYGGIFDPINICYLVCVIVNIMAYIIVMPKK